MPLRALRPCVLLAVAALGAAVAGPALAQQDHSKVEIRTQHVAGPVHMLPGGEGGNLAVSVGPEGVLLVDDQFEPLSDKILAAIARLGGGRPRLVLNTHHHRDHTGGNVRLGRDATIVAHTNVRKRLSTRVERGEYVVEPLPPVGLPLVTYDDAVVVHLNGEPIEVYHLPHGHTDGDSVVYFTGSNVAHVGDLLFTGRFPFVDLWSGGSVQGYIRNLETLLQRLPADAKIIPGHGPLSTIADLRASHKMLVASRDRVAAWKAEGRTLEEAKKAGMPEEYQEWGTGFIDVPTWIEIVWVSEER